MENKELNIVVSVLIDIFLKASRFRLLDQEQEKIQKILDIYVREGKIKFLANSSASNEPYLNLIPKYYSLEKDIINKVNTNLDLYTIENNKYYKVRMNDLGKLVKIPINHDSFHVTEKSIYVSNEIVV